MKSFLHITRRTHLYLAMFCLPWFIMYGITSIAFAHPEWFERDNNLYDTALEGWTEEGAWPCTVEIPESGPIPRDIATELVHTAGIHAGAYGAYRSGPGKVDVYFPSFWETRRLTYRIEEQRLSLHSRPSVTQNTLTGMHARAGYQHDGFLNDAWAVMVDVVMFGFLLWVMSGIYIWWKLPALRVWGLITLVAGIISFAGFLVWL